MADDQDKRGPLADKLENVVKQVPPVEPDTGARTQDDSGGNSPPPPPPPKPKF